MQDITRRDVIELLDSIVDRGKPIAANRALAASWRMANRPRCGTMDPMFGIVELPSIVDEKVRTPHKSTATFGLSGAKLMPRFKQR